MGKMGKMGTTEEGAGHGPRDCMVVFALEQNVLDHRKTAGEARARRRELPPAHARRRLNSKSHGNWS